MMILESRTARLTADVVKSARLGGGGMLKRLIPECYIESVINIHVSSI